LRGREKILAAIALIPLRESASPLRCPETPSWLRPRSDSEPLRDGARNQSVLGIAYRFEVFVLEIAAAREAAHLERTRTAVLHPADEYFVRQQHLQHALTPQKKTRVVLYVQRGFGQPHQPVTVLGLQERLEFHFSASFLSLPSGAAAYPDGAAVLVVRILPVQSRLGRKRPLNDVIARRAGGKDN